MVPGPVVLVFVVERRSHRPLQGFGVRCSRTRYYGTHGSQSPQSAPEKTTNKKRKQMDPTKYVHCLFGAFFHFQFSPKMTLLFFFAYVVVSAKVRPVPSVFRLIMTTFVHLLRAQARLLEKQAGSAGRELRLLTGSSIFFFDDRCEPNCRHHHSLYSTTFD